MNVLPPAVLEALLLQINKAADQHVVDLVLDKRLLVRTSRDGVFYRDPGTETVKTPPEKVFKNRFNFFQIRTGPKFKSCVVVAILLPFLVRWQFCGQNMPAHPHAPDENFGAVEGRGQR